MGLGERLNKIQHETLVTRMNAKYHGRREQVLSRKDRATRVTTALVSLTGAAAAFQAPQYAAGAMGLAMLLAFVSIMTRWTEMSVQHAVLRREWMSLRFRWETFERRLLKMSEDEADALFEELLTERGFISGHEPPSPDEHLLEKMLVEVERETGRDQPAINGTATT